MRVGIYDFDQTVCGVEMQMPVCTYLPSNTKRFGHSVRLGELHLAEDGFQPIS